ncbi:MAG: hypothetical protein WD077_12260 [Bacteroidia bacterium]
MRYKIINQPRECSLQDYHEVIDEIGALLQKQEGILSVYQIGGMTTPGISDLDIIAVFKDDVRSGLNPVKKLGEKGQYLFTHACFGISESHLRESQQYTFYHNYKLLWGKESFKPARMKPAEETELKEQIALEFLLANLISRTTEHHYGILNLRSLFLSVKAILFDLEFLGTSSGPLHEMVNQLISYRNRWFSGKVTNEMVGEWFQDFHQELEHYCVRAFEKFQMYLPVREMQYSKHARLYKRAELKIERRGVMIPPFITALGGRKLYRLNNRLNNFRFGVPYATSTSSDLLKRRFVFFDKMYNYNQKHLPHYLALAGIFGGRIKAE